MLMIIIIQFQSLYNCPYKTMRKANKQARLLRALSDDLSRQQGPSTPPYFMHSEDEGSRESDHEQRRDLG